MGDFEVRQRWALHVLRSSLRALVFVGLTSAALAACARSELGLLAVEQRGANALGGASPVSSVGSAVPSESRAGAAAGGQSGSASGDGGAGRAPGGAAGLSFGGAAGLANGGNAGFAGRGGSAGSGGAAQIVANCDRALIPHLDGPPSLTIDAPGESSVPGDWNGDGKLDLATSNSDGSVTVLLGRGNGTFVSATTYTSGLEARQMRPGLSSIVTGDLDKNGTLDLVVANREGTALSVLLGKSDGTFAAGTTYELGDMLNALVLGDFDDDQLTDIVAADLSGNVTVLHGKGNGSFGDRAVTPVSDYARSMVADDLNGDGHLDLVVLCYTELVVLHGKGDGSFVKAQVFPVFLSNVQVHLADFDADGHADLAVVVSCDMSAISQTSVKIFLGRADGTFADGVKYYTGEGCLDRIILADLNGDGAIDVVTSPSQALLGKGDGTFGPETQPTQANGGSLLSVGDWNGDGKPDLATVSEHTIAVRLGNGDGSFGSSAVYATAVGPGSLVLEDLDQDAVLDIAAATFDSRSGNASTVAVLLGAGDGSFRAHVDSPSLPPTRRPIAVDLNGDGVQDLVTLNGNTAVGVLLGKGQAQFAPQVTWKTAYDIAGFAAGDLNGDGYVDLALANDQSATLTFLFGRGDGTFASERHWNVAGRRPSDLTLIDANGDAVPDIALVSYETGTLNLLLGNGDGTFRPDRQFPTFEHHASITSADLNADGRADLVTWNSTSLSIHLGAGDGGFTRRLDYQGTPNELVAAHVDRDGHQDLVLTGTWPGTGFTVLFGAGDGTLACAANYAQGLYMQGLGSADLNKDGRTDIATTTYAGVNVFLNTTP